MTINIIKKAGYKLTKPRKEIFKLLKKNHTPLSADMIHKKIKHIDLASVYRVLKLFQKLNIVQNDQIQNEQRFYLGRKPHHHIICEKCGHLECVPCHHLFTIKNFYNIKHQIKLTGLCNKCSANLTN